MTTLRKTSLTLTVAAASLIISSAAWAGGNGNGGNGSGGSHGAATSGMTYHSEPVSSPWNRVPGDVSRDDASRMSGRTPAPMERQADPAKTGQ
ncbi:hypothetical protein [Caballeronia sp. INDeC2]|uniref:hypothetical protein n=1 Tax=Caballeronia sp. INDeC2 TaxID=2921747 RepID=UPI002028DEE4|nr:hypothetical protein [Caballeronia sp. INDeC2]